jgi:hypothetical protein
MIMGKITSLILSLVLVAGVITIVSPFSLDDALASGDKKKNGYDREYDDGKDREYDDGKDREYDDGKDREYDDGKDREYDDGKDIDDYKQYDKEYDKEYMKYLPDFDTGEEYDFSDSY